MAKVNLTGMNVEALLNLRNQIDERLVELRAELEKQLAAIAGQPKPKGKSLKGKKVPPKTLCEFARGHFGPCAGWAQQYLFFQERARGRQPLSDAIAK